MAVADTDYSCQRIIKTVFITNRLLIFKKILDFFEKHLRM